MVNELKHLFPDAIIGTDIVLQDDGDGVYIKEWNLASPQPAQAELDAVAIDAALSSALSECMAKRAAAYKNESDPLKNEAEYDAMASNTQPDYTAWVAKVAEIKARYPKP